MKISTQYLFIFFTIILVSPISSQVKQIHGFDQILERTFCELPLGNSKTPISIPYQFKDESRRQALNFTINYLPADVTLNGNVCTSWPAAAEAAFTYAASIWSDVLQNTFNIGVDACWTTDVGGSTLGSAGSNGIFTFAPPPLPATLWPSALVEHVANQDVQAVDINASFNANRSDWYFGTDANPAFNEVDFVSVALHELGHGLGFFGLKNIDDGVIDEMEENPQECDNMAGHGCIGLFLSPDWVPSIYDRFVDIDNESSILGVTNPSIDIANLLIGQSTTGGSGGLDFDETNINQFRNPRHTIHTPGTYVPGSSYSHFSESVLPNELMSPSVSVGQAIHDPGLATTIMLEMGWSAAIVPVELSRFEAAKERKTVLLEWETASEINNDFFNIERSIDGVNFESIGLKKGKNNTSQNTKYDFLDRNPLIGSNYYRLKQVDFGGFTEISDIVQVNFEPEGGNTILSPNPAFDKITLEFNAEADNQVTISIFSIDGIKIMEEKRNNLLTNRININIQDIPKGNYFARIKNGFEAEVLKFIKM